MAAIRTMRAAFYEPGNNKAVLKDIPIPKPTSKQVLLQVAAAGVCHSDVFVLTGFLPDARTYIMGHENVGYAVEYVQRRSGFFWTPWLTSMQMGQ